MPCVKAEPTDQSGRNSVCGHKTSAFLATGLQTRITTEDASLLAKIGLLVGISMSTQRLSAGRDIAFNDV